MITLRACPACGQPATDADFEHRYEQVPPSGQGRLETRLVACRACGHAFSNPQPTWDEVAPTEGHERDRGGASVVEAERSCLGPSAQVLRDD